MENLYLQPTQNIYKSFTFKIVLFDKQRFENKKQNILVSSVRTHTNLFNLMRIISGYFHLGTLTNSWPCTAPDSHCLCCPIAYRLLPSIDTILKGFFAISHTFNPHVSCNQSLNKSPHDEASLLNYTDIKKNHLSPKNLLSPLRFIMLVNGQQRPYISVWH